MIKNVIKKSKCQKHCFFNLLHVSQPIKHLDNVSFRDFFVWIKEVFSKMFYNQQLYVIKKHWILLLLVWINTCQQFVVTLPIYMLTAARLYQHAVYALPFACHMQAYRNMQTLVLRTPLSRGKGRRRLVFAGPQSSQNGTAGNPALRGDDKPVWTASSRPQEWAVDHVRELAATKQVYHHPLRSSQWPDKPLRLPTAHPCSRELHASFRPQ